MGAQGSGSAPHLILNSGKSTSKVNRHALTLKGWRVFIEVMIDLVFNHTDTDISKEVVDRHV